MKKKLIAWIVCVLMLAALCPSAAIADGERTVTSGSCGPDLTWTFDDSTGTLRIEGDGLMDNYTSKEQGYSQQILPPWRTYRNSIKTIEMSEGLLRIGTEAFSGCKALTSVSIPDSMTEIGRYAFKNCTALGSVTFGSGEMTLDAEAFSGCTGITSMTISGNIKNIGNMTFYNCTSLRTLKLEEGVECIGAKSFYDCTSLSSITLPDSLKEIHTNAFRNTAWWNSQPEGIIYLGSNLIGHTGEGAATIDVKDGTKLIAEFGLYGCVNTKSITLPDSMVYIGDSAFASCKNLETITIRNGVKTIGNDAFSGCSKLGSVTLPNSVTRIGDSIFYACTSLQSVTLPNAITCIPNRAFGQCTSLQSIEIPDTVTSIQANAFSGCTSLQSIVIPDSAEDVEYSAFSGCSNITSLTVPCSATYRLPVGKLKTLHLTKGNGVMRDYEYYNYTSSPWYNARQSVQTITLDEGIRHIGGYAFSEYTALRSVNLPDSAESIGEYAFYGCTGLSSVSFGSGMKELGEYAFAGCAGLTSVSLGDGLMRIGNYAFDNCTGLTSVSLGNTAESIGFCAFRGCTGVSAFTIPESVTFVANSSFANTGWWNALPDGLVYLDGCLLGCKGTCPETVTVRDGTRLIAVNAFSACDRLQKAVISNSVQRICSGAFYNCSALASVELGCGVTDIGFEAFNNALRLRDVYYHGTEEYRNEKLPPSAIENGNTYLLNATWHYLPESIEIDDPTVTFGDNVSWKNTTPYMVYNGKERNASVIVKDSAGNTIDSFYYDVSYTDNTKPGTARVTVTFRNDAAEPCTKWFKIYLPATTKTTVENGKDGIRLSWEAVEGAKGYVIYRRAWNLIDAGWTTFERWNNTTGTTWTDAKVYAGTRYQYGVKAYFADPMDNYNLGLVGPLKTTVRITTRTLKSVTAGTKQFTVKWDGSRTVTGYQIKYATDAGFRQNVGAVKVAGPQIYQTTIKGLKSGTTYYVTVRGYQEFEGMTYFGEWSNVIACTVK